jgi:hypothetical protein
MRMGVCSCLTRSIHTERHRSHPLESRQASAGVFGHTGRGPRRLSRHPERAHSRHPPHNGSLGQWIRVRHRRPEVVPLVAGGSARPARCPSPVMRADPRCSDMADSGCVGRPCDAGGFSVGVPFAWDREPAWPREPHGGHVCEPGSRRLRRPIDQSAWHRTSASSRTPSATLIPKRSASADAQHVRFTRRRCQSSAV